MAKKAPEKKKRNAKDFNYNELGPKDLDITDPDAAEALADGIPIDREYPKHLHKAVAPGHAHEYVVVDNAVQERQYLKAGYMSAKDADAVNAAEEAKAAKPKAAKKASAKAAPKKKAAKKSAVPTAE